MIPIAVAPGAQPTADGHGCPANATVTLSIGGVAAGRTTADSSGAFRAPLALGSLGVGSYQVDARCGVLLTAPLQVVLASQVGGDTSTLAIILFFLLLGGALLWPRFGRRRHGRGATR
ncbi:MAG TPA: hypothetical protein VEJ21_05595 [Acidimicrobiales bacterium]|nr:hypothetical protein [Acidimicrobiales bacterium]